MMSTNSERVYDVIVHMDEDGTWAEVPAMQGLYAQGEGFYGAVASVQEAVENYLQTSDEVSINENVEREELERNLGPNEHLATIVFDMAKFKKRNSKAVRKNVTVPGYLVEIAKENGDSLSEILAHALEQKYRLI
ncbi:type II toxin-antitoxin system HicB family antitoxin [Weissella cibaria]|jgi:Uncharacterized conserved protein|uniref:type II toxin-antitoxin system HicB family antitoxin n=1 Tax=Weissella TaxID=46255 RepID=UPI000BFFCEB1|nr:type II toxin-antitoxin system HicB family antitoxin [Weissella cibaria]MCQ9619114.1 type II toxin-antitoxin system HicB family antitoxin [Weissella cibaria]RGO78666.1 hypothetical protein DXA89_07680 [Weissella cibaria]RHE72219.1 hypothetical protein DW718_06690 [Weissella cibaria]RHE78134.1 hypothetical protein DW717_04915 [Weissella cibaria]